MYTLIGPLLVRVIDIMCWKSHWALNNRKGIRRKQNLPLGVNEGCVLPPPVEARTHT